jgi:2-oxoisovalerate dehydrogenase E2 component (dihydrolipoyl transacylase)
MRPSIFKPGPAILRCPYPIRSRHPYASSSPFRRKFHATIHCPAIRTQKLGDVGEGITECMLNMWFVEEGARVEEWDKLCEMQSDKAAVEISANYPGVIKKLYAQANDMVKTGAPLADIDDGLPESDEPMVKVEKEHDREKSSSTPVHSNEQVRAGGNVVAEEGQVQLSEPTKAHPEERKPIGQEFLATPAVRGLLKEHKIDISEVNGSGKDGRILKEDIQAHLDNENRNVVQTSQPSQSSAHSAPSMDAEQAESIHPLSPNQSQMFRTMTASLAIPHFLYTDEVDVTQLSELRKRLNQSRKLSDPKLTLLPFILKAVSISLNHYELLNARIDTSISSARPQLVHRRNHNIGIAIDTPAGLLVPVVKNVGARSIMDIAYEIRRLSELGQNRKLLSADLSGSTITVSNIGNIGGTVVAPVIVEGQVAILGVGKSRAMPIFGADDSVERAEITNFSWSADHRVVDGATMARMGNMVKKFVEKPEQLMVQLR